MKDNALITVLLVAIFLIVIWDDSQEEIKQSVVTLPPFDVQAVRAYGSCVSDAP